MNAFIIAILENKSKENKKRNVESWITRKSHLTSNTRMAIPGIHVLVASLYTSMLEGTQSNGTAWVQILFIRLAKKRNYRPGVVW